MAAKKPTRLTRAPTTRARAAAKLRPYARSAKRDVLAEWLANFDAKLATLDARQNAFFARLGITDASEADAASRAHVFEVAR